MPNTYTFGDIEEASARVCVLFIHETESMEAVHPALRRYYELVAALQPHYGQTLEAGALLEACIAKSGWQVTESRKRELRKPANAMARLHLASLRTWRHDEYARKSFDSSEIDAMEASLMDIANSEVEEGVVINGARQIIAQQSS
jgi:hypothetical protein